MTTQLILLNAPNSNGDVHYSIRTSYADGDEMVNRETTPDTVLSPGEKTDLWISTSAKVEIYETWPTEKPCTEARKQGGIADVLIATEVSGQDKMWGDANERADSKNAQMLSAALAQAFAVREAGLPGWNTPDARAMMFKRAETTFYPHDWNGFRDYGSDIANLVVAAAFLRNEIKRRLMKGESYHRAARTEPYKGPDKPIMSSEEARALSTLMDVTQGTEGGRLKEDTIPAERGRYRGLAGKTHAGSLGSPVVTINEQAHGDEAA